MLNAVVPDGQAFDEAMKIARSIAAAAPEAVQATKRAVNRSYEMAQMRAALLSALETDIEIEGRENPEKIEFNRIRREEGLKAALAWRDAKFAED